MNVDNGQHAAKRVVLRWMAPMVFAVLVVSWVTVAELAAQQTTAEPTSPDLLDGLKLTPRALRAAAERIAPSLVTIESYGGVSAVQGRIGGIRQQGEGNTTGTVVSPDGLVITSSFNFIQQPRVTTVVTADGVRRVADLLGRDDTRGICLLKIRDVSGLVVPEMLDPQSLRVGQWAISVGVGYGDTNPAISMGIISATERIGGRAIQTDANTSPANYGGPLVDIEGRMIGVCVPLSPGESAPGSGVEWYDSGIGFAVPMFGAQTLIERLARGENIQPAFLGIQSSGDEQLNGVKVDEVIADSAAAKAGLEKDDLIVQINQQPVTDMLSLRRILNRHDAGDLIAVTIRRTVDDQQEETTLSVTLGARPQSPEPQQVPGERPRSPGN